MPQALPAFIRPARIYAIAASEPANARWALAAALFHAHACLRWN